MNLSTFFRSVFQNLEWNELIFIKRNKSYGAFELRNAYRKRMNIGILFSILLFMMIVLFPYILELVKFSGDDEFFEEFELTEVSLSDPPKGNQGQEYKPPVLQKNTNVNTSTPEENTKKDPIQPKVIKEETEIKPKAKSDSEGQSENKNDKSNSTQTQEGISNGSSSNVGDSSNTNKVWQRASQMPLFAGCESTGSTYSERKKCSDSKLITFIKSNLKYPLQAAKNKTDGVVLIQFIVEKNGSVSNIKIIKDIGDGCGQEAVRVIEMINSKKLFWQPGIQGSQAIRFQYTLPVEFEGAW